MTEIVAVYGSLRQGEGSHHYLTDSEYLGLGWTQNHYVLYATAYPAVVADEAAYPIRVACHTVSPELLQQLDDYEEHPVLYCRRQVPVVLDQGSVLQAWLYFYPQPEGRRLPTGDWKLR